jgi:hypothetical protein
MLQSKRPGDKAVLAALALAVVASVYLLFYQVPADDRGEPLPAQFRGVAIEARERLTGEEMPDNTVSLLDASGPQIFLVLALPVAVTVFAVWANRRPDRSRMLTFAMLALAGSVILTGGIGIFYFPALIALAVGGFRVRKADLPARVAERTAPVGGRGGRGRGRVIDADSEEVTDGASTDPGESTSAWSRRRRRGATAPVDAAGSDLDESRVVDADVVDADVDDADVDVAELADAELADAPDTEDAGDEVEYDPLAELEAELEAERATDQGSDYTGSGESGDNGRSRRRR